jgi:hypothetical protein
MVYVGSCEVHITLIPMLQICNFDILSHTKSMTLVILILMFYGT